MPIKHSAPPLSPTTPPEAGYAPRPVPGSERTLPPLALDPSHNFRFLVHPVRYDVFMTGNGAEILPIPNRFEFQPGLHGVLPVKGETDGDPSHALLERSRKGWIEVPDDFPVTAFGEAMTRYSQAYPVKGGQHHCEVWTRPYRVGVTVYWQRDFEGYWQFLRDVQAQILPPLDPNVRELLRQKFVQLRKLASVKDTPYTRETIAALDLKMTAFEAA